MKLIMENWKKFLKETVEDAKTQIQNLSDKELQHLLTKHRFNPDHPEARAAHEEATVRLRKGFSDATPEGGWAQGMEPTFPPEEDKKSDESESVQAVEELVGQYPDIEYEKSQEIAWFVRDLMNTGQAAEEMFAVVDQELEIEEVEFAKRLIALNLKLQRERDNIPGTGVEEY